MSPYASPFEDLFYFEIMNGILAKSTKYGYNIVIDNPKKGDLPDTVYAGDADGIIFMQDISPSMKKKAIASGIPFVVVDAHDSDSSVVSVRVDYTEAAYMAMTHLIENGHKDIALISSNVVPDFYKQTLRGFERALTENSIPINPEFVGIMAENEESAYDAAKKVLSLPKRPTAILCAIDTFAIGAMRCAKDMKLSVPDDVSFIGIDDILLAKYIEPKLTTIKIDKAEMGSVAMDLLRRMIAEKPAKSASASIKLLIRDSVKDVSKK